MHLYRFIQWLDRVRFGLLASFDGLLHRIFGSSLIRGMTDSLRWLSFMARRTVARIWLWIVESTVGASWFRSTTDIARSGAAHAGAIQERQLNRFSRLPFIGTTVRALLFGVSCVWLWVLDHTIGSSWYRSTAQFAKTVFAHAGAIQEHQLNWLSNLPVVGVFVRFLRRIGNCVFLLTDFLLQWIASRNYRSLFRCIPVVVASIPFVIALVRMPFQTDDVIARDYRIDAFVAMKNNESEKAEFLLRRVTLLGGESVQETYSKATLAAKRGEMDAAYELMKQLAPEDSIGVGEAHLWIANEIVFGTLVIDKEKQESMLEHHLTAAREQLPDSPKVTHLLALFYRATNRAHQAVEVLGSLDVDRMHASDVTKLAQMYRRCGNKREAMECAELACKQYQKESGRLELVEDYFSWAEANRIRNQPYEAIDALIAGQRKLNDPRLELAIGREAGSFLRSDQPLDARKALVSRVLPECRGEKIQVAVVTQLINPKTFEELYSTVAEYTDRLEPVAKAVLGDALLANRKFGEARSVYDAVLHSGLANASVSNNLAWLYSDIEPIDLKKALEHSNNALSLSPNNPSLLDTRGQILAKLGRWDEAVNDLSSALNGTPDSLDIHKTLALCYRKIGNFDLAKLHEAQLPRPQFQQ